MDEHPVVAVGVDRLHRRVVQQRLQAGQAEQFVDDLGDHPPLNLPADQRPVVHQLVLAVRGDRVVEDRVRQLAAGLPGDRGAGAALLGIHPHRQLGAEGVAQVLAQPPEGLGGLRRFRVAQRCWCGAGLSRLLDRGAPAGVTRRAGRWPAALGWLLLPLVGAH